MVRFLKALSALFLVLAPCALAQPIYGPLQSQNNLSDLNSIPTAQTNLLGSTASLGGPLVTTGNATLSGTGTYYPGHALVGVQTFCASGCTATGGTYTPDAGTNSVIVEVQAPGGGSAGCPATAAGQLCVTSGGASGSYARILATTGFSGVSVTAAPGGAAGAAGANAGGAGGNASFGSLVTCPGGPGAAAGVVNALSNWAAAAGTPAPPAACTISGGFRILAIGGLQGTWPQASGTTADQQTSGQGGFSQLGIPSQTVFTSTAQAGTTGTGYGEGATGCAMTASQPATAGAAGGPGIVIVYEFN